MRRFYCGTLMAPDVAGGGGGGGGTPPPLTMDLILTEVNKVVTANVSGAFDKFKREGLGTAIEEKLAPLNTSLAGITESLAKLTTGSGGGGGGNPPPPDRSTIPPEVNVQLKGLQETTKAQGSMIENLKKEREEAIGRAEKSDRHSVIRTALNNLHFTSEEAGKTAFMIVEPHIRRIDGDQLVGGIGVENFPVDAFVKDYLTKEHSYLLRATGASGSGASGGGLAGRMGVKADISDIKIGMRPEVREQVVASIGAALQSA